MLGEVEGYLYLGRQTPAFYAKRVIVESRRIRDRAAAAVLRRTGGVRLERQHRVRLSRAPGRAVLRKSPAGQLFFKHFGEEIFRNDLCNADVDLGDLLIHVGAAAEAKHAARIFGADRTYFVLNGTSTSNKVVTGAAAGDLVLFDRNNHKSLHQGALVQAGAIPVFLPTARNPFGMIGAVDWDAWDEKYLREQIRNNPLVKDPSAQRAAPVPPRLHPTRDVRRHRLQRGKVLERIGHLCDYVLWDEAWIGYNAFHPLFQTTARCASEGRAGMPGSSRRSRCTSRAPASRRHRRSTSATNTSAANAATSNTSGSTKRS